MSWLDELLGQDIDDVGLWTGVGGYLLKDQFKDEAPPRVGYQGKIPEYEAVRSRVEIPEDPNRRPGSGGRRYFSDMIMAARPESEPMPAEQARAQTQAQATELAVANGHGMAAGGIATLAEGKYLSGGSDGMADKVPASINGEQPAALSDGEFVIPADVVSHLGNGNSDAGAKVLYDMMDRIRHARTGSKKQGKQISPDKFVPKTGEA